MVVKRYNPHEDTVIGGRYPIKQSERCLVLLSGLHRDPSVWGKDVERFDPDRFAPEVFNQMPINAYRRPFRSITASSCVTKLVKSL